MFGGVILATDLLPPRLRYGYVHRLTRTLFRRPLPSVGRPGTPPERSSDPAQPSDTELTCLLLADRLDIGGIGSVVEMLSDGLGAWGVRPVVVCHGPGARADRIRARGVEVHTVHDAATAAAAIAVADADAIQLHSAPEYLEQAAMESGLPLVPVLHNTEIHFTPDRWDTLSRLLDHSSAAIAVSRIVRDYSVRQLGDRASASQTNVAWWSRPDGVDVVPNGAPGRPPPSDAERRSARRAVEAVTGTDLSDAVVFVLLARYDAQKNIAGTVATFVRAAEVAPLPLHLVVAGEPSDWAELRRADALRRGSPRSDQVHLLSNSDAWSLLSAADAFLLNSFFEGWPVAATEAAAAGLPLVLSDVGGARELVGRDPGRSRLVANASGLAEQVSDAAVRGARRQARRQSNTADLVAALCECERLVSSDTGRNRADTPDGTAGPMLAAHAQILQRVTGKPPGPN